MADQLFFVHSITKRRLLSRSTHENRSVPFTTEKFYVPQPSQPHFPNMNPTHSNESIDRSLNFESAKTLGENLIEHKFETNNNIIASQALWALPRLISTIYILDTILSFSSKVKTWPPRVSLAVNPRNLCSSNKCQSLNDNDNNNNKWSSKPSRTTKKPVTFCHRQPTLWRVPVCRANVLLYTCFPGPGWNEQDPRKSKRMSQQRARVTIRRIAQSRNSLDVYYFIRGPDQFPSQKARNCRNTASFDDIEPIDCWTNTLLRLPLLRVTPDLPDQKGENIKVFSPHWKSFSTATNQFALEVQILYASTLRRLEAKGMCLSFEFDISA